MANDVAMDNLYLAMLNEFVEEVTVERVLDYLCALNRPAFERASADNRIVIEAYKYVVQERKSHPRKSSRLKGVPELDLTPHAELYIPRERFDGFLSALFQFSILWEAYSLANIRIRNALVSKHEYEATFSRRHELFGLQFKSGLTRAMWDSEFDILDNDGSNRITFHELCIYFTTHVISPTLYLRHIRNQFSFYDMDADSGPYGGALPCKDPQGIFVTFEERA